MIVLSSCLYVLSFPKFSLYYLAWIALVPLVLVILQEQGLRRWQAFRWGWACGTLGSLGLLYWLIPTYRAAHQPLALAGLCLVLLASYLGLFWGAWAELMRTFRKLNPAWLCVLGASAWVALEYLRTWLFSGFPWALLADSQVTELSLIQIASVTGAYGVSFLIVLFNLWGACQLHFRYLAPRTRKRSYLFLPPMLLVISYLWGTAELTHKTAAGPAGKPLQVALLQGNIDQYKKWNESYVSDILDHYQSMVKEAARRPVELIVWPETSIPAYLLQDSDIREWLVQTVRSSRTHHLIGAPTKVSKKFYNSSFSMNREGLLEAQYDKIHLVPFGEIVPLANILGRFVRALNELGGFTSGSRDSVMRVAGIPMGITICYEAIFPDLVRRAVRDGAQVLTNQTNDGWYMKTSAPYQHWAPNIYRAIENRRYLLRANNTGISGIIDPWGRMVASSRIFEPAIVTGSVEPLQNLTFYTRHGDLFAMICSVFCIAILLLVILRRS